MFRRRQWIALLAVFGLLFQQLAMAAYVCPQEWTAPSTAMLAVDLPPCHEPEDSDLARCQEHCHPSSALSEQVLGLGVPPLLAAVTWLFVDVPAADSLALRQQLRARAQPPPISIQHCTFQI